MYGYNNYQSFYPQYVPQVQQPMQAPQQMPTDDRIFVQGEVGAKAYFVAPGNTVTLWDAENAVIYRKTMNAQGVPSLQRLTYTFDTSSDSTQFDKRLRGIEERLAALENPKEVEENA